MSDRIRQLEDALAILQSTLTREPHPLLDRELLKIKSSIELHSAIDSEAGELREEETEDSQYIDAFGTLAVRDDGAATFYGRSAGSEVSFMSPTFSRFPARPNKVHIWVVPVNLSSYITGKMSVWQRIRVNHIISGHI